MQADVRPLEIPMKIGSSIDVGSPATDIAARTASRAADAKPAHATQATEQVALSAMGAQMGASSGSGDFDAAKVDAIKQAIREGRFSVNPEAIADRLIADARALMNPRS
jgi:negative regulator of flagellin synthesis FlgM